jgi:hypothetical protein
VDTRDQAPDHSPSGPGKAAPDATPETEPPVTAPESSDAEPAIEVMKAAVPSGKMTVAVGLLYAITGDPASGAISLNLAAIPRVGGSNLNVSIKAEPGISVAAAPLVVQKANAAGTYRKQMSVALTPEIRRIRVLVTMDLPEGTGFGFYSIPLEPDPKSGKQDLVKQP